MLPVQNRKRLRSFVARMAILALIPQLSGCCTHLACLSHETSPQPHYLPECEQLAAQVEYPDVAREASCNIGSRPPRTFRDGPPEDYWDMSLEDAVRMGLQSSDILKDLGGRILASPQAVGSVFDPSITMSHPRLGEEAALAAFDAQWAQALTGGAGSQAFNNTTLGGGGTIVDSDFLRLQSQLAKRSATGAQYSVRSLFDYQNSDAPFNLFPSVFNGQIEASVRQPLLQGSGAAFNRIAGPSGSNDFGVSRGVVLARIDGDISVASFEQSVRDYVNGVESAYWSLYLAYRNLETSLRARDLARETWLASKARYDADLQGGQADVEAQAREQLYQFEQAVIQSLNGSTDGGGTGVYQAERQLRRLLGLSMNDGRLIRPADEPTDAPIRFDWDSCMADALFRRVELRQQMWRIRQRELELFAARNFLLPRVDAIGTYRTNGFGDNLLGGDGDFSSLGRELFSFDFDQYEVGLQMNVPLGYRRELAGVRHAELNLARERAVLRDQEHQISMDLAEAVSGLDTTFENVRLAYNRMAAAEQVVGSRQAVFDAGKSTIQDLLESQRRLADAMANYYQARVSHMRSITRVHFEKGTLLPYNGVYLSEGGWDERACYQFARESSRYQADLIDYRQMTPTVSRGRFTNEISGGGVPVDATYHDEIIESEAMDFIQPEPSDIIQSDVLDRWFGESTEDGSLSTDSLPGSSIPQEQPTVVPQGLNPMPLNGPIEIVPDLPPEIPVSPHVMPPAVEVIDSAPVLVPTAKSTGALETGAVTENPGVSNSRVSLATFFELTGGKRNGLNDDSHSAKNGSEQK